MAFASSRIEAQETIIKPCDLCEDDEDVDWFCKDCVQSLCERCKNMHLKIAICKNHRLVSILEGVVIQKANVSNLCHEHNEPFLFFCQTCEENICSICLSKVHKKHDFTDLLNFHSELENRLENVIQEKEEEQMKMTKNIDEMEKCSDQWSDTVTKTYSSIDDRVESIITAVNEQGQKLKKSVKSTTDKQIKEVEEQKQKIKGRKNEYEETIKTVKHHLKLQTTSTFGQFVETSTSKLQSLKPMTYPIPNSTKFTAGGTNQDLIMEMIGKTEDKLEVVEYHEKEKIKGINILQNLQIVTVHELDVKNECLSICSSPDGSIWIGGLGYVYKMRSDYSAVLCQIPATSRVFLDPEPLWCDNIACLQSGDAVVTYSYGGDGKLDRFTSEGKREEFINSMGKWMGAIAITNQDEVVITVIEGGEYTYSYIALYPKEEGSPMTITMDAYMGLVTGLCINKDGNCVIMESGLLTTLDRSDTDKKLKQIGTSKYGLRRLTCDRYGNVLGVPEIYTNSYRELYLISDDGDVERSFTVKCDNNINDICIDSDNCLHILVDYKKVIVAKYLE